MALLIIRRMVSLAQPTRLRIRHPTNRPRDRFRYALLLAFDGSDLETRVARGKEDFVAMEGEEGFGGVGPGYFGVEQDGETTWVEGGELGRSIGGG